MVLCSLMISSQWATPGSAGASQLVLVDEPNPHIISPAASCPVSTLPPTMPITRERDVAHAGAGAGAVPLCRALSHDDDEGTLLRYSWFGLGQSPSVIHSARSRLGNPEPTFTQAVVSASTPAASASPPPGRLAG